MAKKKVAKKSEGSGSKMTLDDAIKIALENGVLISEHELNIAKLNKRLDRLVAALSTAKVITKNM